MKKKILVVGSMNMDLIFRVQRIPESGETIAGLDFFTAPGGKGANQAVAAARAGGDVHMIGCVGDDPFGDQLVQSLHSAGVNSKRVRRVTETSTGTALIILEADGFNRIVIIPGANSQVSETDIEISENDIQDAGAVLLQFEIPLPTIEYTIQCCKKIGTPVILNPAPSYPDQKHLCSVVDVLIMNEIEAEQFCGQKVAHPDDAQAASRLLHESGVPMVMITLGDKGVWLSEAQEAPIRKNDLHTKWLDIRGSHIPAYRVTPIDTTAAGDTFVGAFATRWTAGESAIDAVRFAVAAAALAVTREGAQTSIPTFDEIQAFIREFRNIG
jgi:ribokinase